MYHVESVAAGSDFLVADDPVMGIIDVDLDTFIKRIKQVEVLASLCAFAVAVHKCIVDFHCLIGIMDPHLHRKFDRTGGLCSFQIKAFNVIDHLIRKDQVIVHV